VIKKPSRSRIKPGSPGAWRQKLKSGAQVPAAVRRRALLHALETGTGCEYRITRGDVQALVDAGLVRRVRAVHGPRYGSGRRALAPICRNKLELTYTPEPAPPPREPEPYAKRNAVQRELAERFGHQ
jgi:hypothetical protein